MKGYGRLAALCLMLFCLCACAAAQETQSAVAAPEDAEHLVAMLDMPDDGGRLLMSYASGAPLQVLMNAGSGYVLAQSGEAGAGIMGYIRKEHLRFGDIAPRVTQPVYYRMEFTKEMPVYAYPDAGAQVIGVCVPGKTYYWMGLSANGYAQLCLPPAVHIWEEKDRMIKGFVALRDSGVSVAQSERVMPWSWPVKPRFGEATENVVIALAKEYILENAGRLRLPEAYQSGETLKKLGCRAERMQTLNSLIGDWWVYFWEEEGGTVVRVYVWADGGADKEPVVSLDVLTPDDFLYMPGVIPIL